MVHEESLVGAGADVKLQVGDVVALGGRFEDLTSNMGLIGPEVADPKALNIPLDQAEVLVTNKALEGKALKEFRNEEFAGQLQYCCASSAEARRSPWALTPNSSALMCSSWPG